MGGKAHPDWKVDHRNMFPLFHIQWPLEPDWQEQAKNDTRIQLRLCGLREREQEVAYFLAKLFRFAPVAGKDFEFVDANPTILRIMQGVFDEHQHKKGGIASVTASNGLNSF